jgi:poly-gamma-glutamate synthase PgsB/CapB
MQTLSGIYAVSVLILIFIIIYRRERSHHEKRLQNIPIRVWVNGSRGKSSVTRLIAAGLRAKGMKVIAKTTGTAPRFIIDNLTEEPIIRLGMANIREQIKIVERTHQYEAQAMVFECMALRPDLQRIESRQILHPTIVVITNVRPDHLDVMGPSLTDIRKTFLSGIPAHCTVITTDRIIAQQCKNDYGFDCMVVDADTLDDHARKTIAHFDHIEHEENIALALTVCKHCGIPANDALQSMRKATPDPGALRQLKLCMHDKHIVLINAMAANDPESTRIIWHRISKDQYPHTHILINCRKDRLDRTVQFVTMIQDLFLDTTSIILTGSATSVLYNRIKKFYHKEKILDLGSKNTAQARSLIASHVLDNSLLFAMGNTVGYGMELIQKLTESKGPAC